MMLQRTLSTPIMKSTTENIVTHIATSESIEDREVATLFHSTSCKVIQTARLRYY